MASDSTNQLKSDALMEQMKQHLASDAGKQITKKINLVYQINIAPKVPLFSLTPIASLHLLYTQFCSDLLILFIFFVFQF
jgi:hypothetical protein